jgi:hypothetical protein
MSDGDEKVRDGKTLPAPEKSPSDDELDREIRKIITDTAQEIRNMENRLALERTGKRDGKRS